MAKLLLDLTRTASRLHHAIPTGIDRVEQVYFEHALRFDDSLFLIRFRYGFVYLFDNKGIIEALSDPQKSQFQQSLRFHKYAKQSLRYHRLAPLYRNLNAEDYRYYNVGHSHLADENWAALRAARMNSTVMVHDLIPLDYPEFTRDDRRQPFENAMKNVLGHATRIITPSTYSKTRVLAWRERWQCQNPQDVIANPLGFSPMTTTRAPTTDNAYLTVGTIEARKNHIFLLRLWDELVDILGKDTPKLWIVGNEGWKIDDVKAWQDEDRPAGDYVHFLGPIRDAELSGYAARARALLFPSFVEGFGLPLFEAVSAGIPTLASDIPAFREVSLNNLTILPLNNQSIWRDSIVHERFQKTYFKNENFPNWNKHLTVTFSE